MPAVQPSAAQTLARRGRATRPVETVKTTPGPGDEHDDERRDEELDADH